MALFNITCQTINGLIKQMNEASRVVIYATNLIWASHEYGLMWARHDDGIQKRCDDRTSR